MASPNLRKLPEEFSILSPDYMRRVSNAVSQHSPKDKMINQIIESDRFQKEIIKRLILEESRLDIFMRLLGLRVAQHHLLFINYWEHLESKGIKKGMLLAPRGSGKSTVCDVCWTAMKALQDPNLCILIASRTSDQAQAFLSAVKGMFVKQSFVDVFGDVKGDKWDEQSISLKGREPGKKENTFHIAGADGTVVSKHFDIIVCDDVVEEKNAKSETNRATVLRFFYRSLLPTLKPGGIVRVLGTRYHPEDLYGYLSEKDPSYKNSTIVLPAVFDKDTGEPIDLIEQPDGSFALPENGQVWDAEGFPVKEVCERRQGMPLGDFEAQYQNRVEFLRGDYFDSAKFQYYTEAPAELVRQLGLRVWMGVDLAASQKESADEFAVVVVGIEPSSFKIYVLDYIAGRFLFTRQKQILVDMFDQWDPIRTFVEANAYQSVLESTVKDEFPDVRTQPIFTTVDKITRAMAFSTYYDRGQVFHRKNRSAKLDGQLAGFPHAKLKDLFDALYIAVWGAMRGARKRRAKEPGLIG